MTVFTWYDTSIKIKETGLPVADRRGGLEEAKPEPTHLGRSYLDEEIIQVHVGVDLEFFAQPVSAHFHCF